MSDYSYVKLVVYASNGSFAFEDGTGGTLGDPGNDDTYQFGEVAGVGTYQGTMTILGVTGPAFDSGDGSLFVYLPSDPGSAAATSAGAVTNQDYVFCFAAGTQIATPRGEIDACSLRIGDLVTTTRDRHVQVKWIGRQTVSSRFCNAAAMALVRIRTGALGHGRPHSDLTVTADHGMVLDGYVINASALVNGDTIDFVPMAELEDSFTVYHIETEAHDVILANGAPSETFIDYQGRKAFDNYGEYLDLYGAERLIPEMPQPRISSARMLPTAIRQRFGIATLPMKFAQTA